MTIRKDGLRIAVAIATAGRRDILAQTIEFFDNQTRRPDAFFVCPAKTEDVDIEALHRYNGPIEIVRGPIGSSHQRNAMMAASDVDVMVFFDDDFLPAPNYLAEVESLLESEQAVVVATGYVVADGISGVGLAFDDGVRLLNDDKPQHNRTIEPVFNGYGCNMAVRMAPVREYGLRFDENLPLYAWLEDVDFSRQLAPYGQIVKSSLMRGVHLGTKKAGRSPGRRLGYSQIANSIYIYRKGNMSLGQAWASNLRNLTANVVRSLNPEPWADRRGRLMGNLIALKDLATGKIDPEKILKM